MRGGVHTRTEPVIHMYTRGCIEERGRKEIGSVEERDDASRRGAVGYDGLGSWHRGARGQREKNCS